MVIDNDGQDEVSEEVQAPANPDALSVDEMVEIVKNAGIDIEYRAADVAGQPARGHLLAGDGLAEL